MELTTTIKDNDVLTCILIKDPKEAILLTTHSTRQLTSTSYLWYNFKDVFFVLRRNLLKVIVTVFYTQLYGNVWAKLQRAFAIWSGFGMTLTGVHTCGDYMFSGHTVVLTMLNFFVTECKYTVSIFKCPEVLRICTACCQPKVHKCKYLNVLKCSLLLVLSQKHGE